MAAHVAAEARPTPAALALALDLVLACGVAAIAWRRAAAQQSQPCQQAEGHSEAAHLKTAARRARKQEARGQRLPPESSRRAAEADPCGGPAVAAEVVVPAELAGETVEAVLMRLLARDFPSRGAAKRAAKRSLLLLDGKACEASAAVAAGSRVQYVLGRERAHVPYVSAPALALPLLYQDEWLAAVVKPQGVAVQGEGERALRQAASALLPPPPSRPDALPRPQHVCACAAWPFRSHRRALYLLPGRRHWPLPPVL